MFTVLLPIAKRLWRSGSAATMQGEERQLEFWRACRLGFLTNIMNPKSALFFGSVFATALPAQPDAELLAAAVALVFVNAFAWHTFLALAFSLRRIQAGYARQRKRLNRAAGAVVGAFGLRLLVLTASEARAH